MAKRKKKKPNPNARPLGYRKKALAEMNAKYSHYNLKSNLIGSLFLVGLILTIWEMFIYNKTLIPLSAPLAIWVLTGAVMTPVLKKIINIYLFNPYTPGRTAIFYHFVFNTVSFGGIAIFLFMWTNQKFNDQSKTTVTVPIVSYEKPAKHRECGYTHAIISYKELEKELVFPCGTDVKKYDKIAIEVSRGFFGFEVITNQTLVEGQW